MTDDPGTPGPGRWEINLAFTLDRTSASREIGAPLVDVNYGWGERLQLKLEIPWIVADDDVEGRRSGLGNPLLGVKWRFLDGDEAGVAVSTYPQLGFNLLSSSADRGLVERETSFLLPVSAVKRLGPVSLDVEAGRLFQAGESSWVWGVALGHEFGKAEALAELFGTSGAAGQEDDREPRWTSSGWGSTRRFSFRRVGACTTRRGRTTSWAISASSSRRVERRAGRKRADAGEASVIGSVPVAEAPRPARLSHPHGDFLEAPRLLGPRTPPGEQGPVRIALCSGAAGLAYSGADPHGRDASRTRARGRGRGRGARRPARGAPGRTVAGDGGGSERGSGRTSHPASVDGGGPASFGRRADGRAPATGHGARGSGLSGPSAGWG